MGAPIRRLVVASNENDILARFLLSGTMSTADVVPTLSPSMDIQVSSNFERLLFEMNARSGERTAEQLVGFRATGRLETDPAAFEKWIRPVFVGSRSTDHDTLSVMRALHEETGMLVDPHTAVGLKAAREHAEPGVPMVTMATAHPAKFPDAVERATGVRPQLPAHLADLMERSEHTVSLPNDLAAVQRFVAGAFD
jgi:threonine synthase